MTPKPLAHDPDILIHAGYTPTACRRPGLPAYPTLCKVAREHRVSLERVTAFRMNEGDGTGWQCWLTPEPPLPHVTRAPGGVSVLPKTTNKQKSNQ